MLPLLCVPPRGIRFAIRIIFFNVQLGHAEPFYGTLCVYNMDRKEKVSEDFHFQFLPPNFEGVSATSLFQHVR